MPDKFADRSNVVTTVAFALKRDLTTLCGPRGEHDTRESWLRRGARAAGISYRQARSFFYCEHGDPRSGAALRVQDALARRRNAAAEQQAEEAAARDEFRAALRRIEILEQRLAAFDPDVARAMADAALGGLAQARRVDRPVDQE